MVALLSVAGGVVMIWMLKDDGLHWKSEFGVRRFWFCTLGNQAIRTVSVPLWVGWHRQRSLVRRCSVNSSSAS